MGMCLIYLRYLAVHLSAYISVCLLVSQPTFRPPTYIPNKLTTSPAGYKEQKDTYILGGVDEVMAVLEDSMVIVATISASRFVAGIRSEVERTERSLRMFSDTLDEWLECQRQWLYLETIFRCEWCLHHWMPDEGMFAVV